MAFRPATVEDLPAIVALLADDPLGAPREANLDPLPKAYHDAFARMQQQPGNDLIVAVDQDSVIQGCLQLTITAGLARQGLIRATIEGVRIAKAHRGTGLGTRLFEHAIGLAKAAGCGMIQLTTDSQRTEAHGFYTRLGFTPSHVGMKLTLSPHDAPEQTRIRHG
ncbi:GNAT family N-acetyltransferase [Actibacterium sp. 188UL27-1]|uniref:GNAT family N-acetyltransferase n=1 Tax=Actibacterium sp. 188UL27-1 TaxID=2786961 RepID=UPI001958999F|nr:GNAT family N-acetyltransferase [Actibacterium sp. 188UL27-1]MBM7067627.1 GNAT family N-acetyltransferase [Actibacterium sp. 188UL27-1]